MADVHLGAWREPKINQLNNNAFCTAMDDILIANVDFLLISGDLFNSSLPGVNTIKTVVKHFKLFQENGIPIYLIAGSHDYSPTGKTLLSVLEQAGLCEIVSKGEIVNEKLKLKFTIDKKTNAKITGVMGKAKMLDSLYYNNLDNQSLELENGFKIFMFHTTLSELKPKEIKGDSQPLSLLPRGFNYYAGGHVHIKQITNIKGYGTIVYPGPLFPNNFKELEDKTHGFVIYDDSKSEKIQYISLDIFPIKSFVFNAETKTPEILTTEILEKINNINNSLVLVRIQGELEGKISSIDFKTIFSELYKKGAYFVMKNTLKLTSKEFNEIIIQKDDVIQIEDSLIKENIGKFKTMFEETGAIKELMNTMASELMEGETISDFNKRVLEEIYSKIKL